MEWQYQILNFVIANEDAGIEKAQSELNELGNEGWEIFAILPGTSIPGISKGAQSWLYAFAKRPT